MQGILIYDESERKFTTVLWAMQQMDMPRMARALIDSAHDAENVASEAYLSLFKKKFSDFGNSSATFWWVSAFPQ